MVKWPLYPDEKKIHETCVSRKLFVKNYCLALILFIAAVGVNLIKYPLPKLYASVILGAGGVIAVLAVERKRNVERMLITNARVLIMRKLGGQGGKIVLESIAFDKLSNVQVVQTMKQRALGIGDLVFRLPGEEHIVANISNPYEIEKAIYRILEIERERAQQST